MMNQRSAVLLGIFIAVVAVSVYLARPTDVAFLGFGFFLGFSVLPCVASALCVLPAANSTRELFLRVPAAVVIFIIAWLVQRWCVARYALMQSNPTTEGLISNFYVFTHVFLTRAVIVAFVSLWVMALAKRSALRSIP